ncbi:MAG: nitroreductase family deazaflavin-dependent oxidoreductase [Myxococcota bacterium]|jgi:deazaflavin-dependent oxidoreductase (nitroreductase family)|nr:hypothetical protein [Deltaproteobacteria bacterium]MCP4241672.1 nitroreductase family deazaflavin-dependent oxidoreductase [bacterium]MDP6075169.1 nitroreductase family deazaflavin-dependent oxidoreductase [Myxococcota bacterium]MDP7075912.1 nitroreductase family deazaflavin-dependent oxidoreductase [Myxococcota bacterium]MDP7298292.1 nitroreductase family deazaflavin-dependent oxidoreductase [Myxococcota bacterium]
MARKLTERPRPSGLLRLALRAPIPLYRWHLGWLLGERFLLLGHRGAKTGLPRKTLLEVVHRDPESGSITVAAGFGSKSHWFRNLEMSPNATVQVGTRRFGVRAEFLDEETAGDIMAGYARRNPRAARTLMRFCGFEVDGSEADYREVAQLGLRFVRLKPRASD